MLFDKVWARAKVAERAGKLTVEEANAATLRRRYWVSPGWACIQNSGLTHVPLT
jgi:hypothetical protein